MFSHTAEFPLTVTGDERRSAGYGRWLAIAGLLALLVTLYAARALSLAPVSMAGERRVTEHAEVITDFGRRPSHNRRYHAEVISAGPQVLGASQQWVIRLTGRNQRRVANAEVRARAWMPVTGVESSARAVASYIGRGRYLVDGVQFDRAGLWSVALIVDGRAGVDSLAFNVMLPE